MGDPGVPVMLALLAVPVAVLLFVVVLALMGGRWTAPDTELDLDLDEQPEGHGWDRTAEPVAPALPAPPVPAALPAGRPSPEYALPAARPRAALPPAPPAYGAYSRDPYDRPQEDHPSSRQGFPYGPYPHH